MAIRDQGRTDLMASLVAQLDPLLRRRLLADAQTRNLCPQPADIDDVLQETYLRLWQHRHRFEESLGEIDTWAWAIARNAALSVLRQWKRRGSSTNLVDIIADPKTIQPGVQLEMAEMEEALTRSLEQQTPQVRQVLQLRLVEGQSYLQVSRATGVPVGTVATWVFRLHRLLASEG